MKCRNGANSRKGKRARTVLTDTAGEVGLEVPRDREGTFASVFVANGKRGATMSTRGCSLYVEGLMTGDQRALR